MLAAPDRRTIRPGRRAFTLIELVAVLAVTGILAVITIPALNSVDATRSAGAAERLARHLTFARELATTTASNTWLVVDVTTNRYSLLAESASLPGRSGATTITNPGTQRPFVEQLGANDAVGSRIISISLEGQSEAGFDRLGRPMRTDGTLWTSEGLISLSNSWSVRIAPRTGLARATNAGATP